VTNVIAPPAGMPISNIGTKVDKGSNL
jgi:hypothetical protein